MAGRDHLLSKTRLWPGSAAGMLLRGCTPCCCRWGEAMCDPQARNHTPRGSAAARPQCATYGRQHAGSGIGVWGLGFGVRGSGFGTTCPVAAASHRFRKTESSLLS